MTDEIAFVAGGGTPIPRLKAHAAALHDYDAHPAWAFRDPVTSAREPIYSVHYNLQAARAMSVAFQRQCWQIHQLTHWAGNDAWIKQAQAQYRRFVYLSAWSTPRASRPIPSSGRSSASYSRTCAPPGTPGR